MKKYQAQDWINPKVEIRPSRIHGKGMFAVTPISRNEIVAIWGGNFVDGLAAEKARLTGKAIQQIDDDVFEVFDYEKKGEGAPTYYHNHSCDPNTWMEDEVAISARRDIEPGEELTIDYAMFEADENRVMLTECNSGSASCRKRITGKDWALPELQARYGNHFSPMINRKISQKRSG